MINGPGPRTRRADGDRASYTCASSAMATTSPSSVGAPRGFPLVKDLIVDARRSIASSSRADSIGVGTGGAPDGNLIPIPKPVADASMDAAAWHRLRRIAWPRARRRATTVHVGEMQHLNLLPQAGRALGIARSAGRDHGAYFGVVHQTTGNGEAACPKSISIDFIALMNKDYAKAQLKQRRLIGQSFP